MAVAPVGGWIAAGGRAGIEPWLLGLAIGLWVGGFDVLYACQDLDFDRRHGLRSIPVRFGVAAAIRISRAMHVVTVVAMAALWSVADLPSLYMAGVIVVGCLLAYEQSLVSERRPVAGEKSIRPERLRGHHLLCGDSGIAVPWIARSVTK